MKVAVVPQLDVAYLLDGCVLEPWELLKRQEILLAFEKQPEAVLGNIRDLRLQSAFATP